MIADSHICNLRLQRCFRYALWWWNDFFNKIIDESGGLIKTEGFTKIGYSSFKFFEARANPDGLAQPKCGR